jgi:uncharacterized protein YaiE (UPF0345 family)
MTDWPRALIRKGLQSHYWGPVTGGTYAQLAEKWPVSNPALPSEADLLAELAIDDEAIAKKTKTASILAEAERRIAAGITVNGKPFRADDISVMRMKNLAGALAVAAPGTTQTFRTAAGDQFTVDAAQAAAISTAQIRWQGAILGASAALQANPPLDPTADANWPAKPGVTV